MTCGTLGYEVVSLIALVMEAVTWVGAIALRVSTALTALTYLAREIFVIWMKSPISRLAACNAP